MTTQETESSEDFDWESEIDNLPTEIEAAKILQIPTVQPDAPWQVAEQIVQATDLAQSSGRCLSCGNRVLAMDDQAQPTLFCRAMFRDIKVTISKCTAWQDEEEMLKAKAVS